MSFCDGEEAGDTSDDDDGNEAVDDEERADVLK